MKYYIYMTEAQAEFAILNPPDYFNKLKELIPNSKHRILIASMTFGVGQNLTPVFELIKAATARGVLVEMYFDAYDTSWRREEAFKNRVRARNTKKLVDELRGAGARIEYTGRVGLNPFSGRRHGKVTIIDDDVFSFGGVNMDEDSLDTTDYMLHTENTLLADKLANILRNYHLNSHDDDKILHIDSENTLLFDGGQPKHSVIYEQAVELANKSNFIYFSSRMCPSGPLAKSIVKTKSLCLYNKPGQSPFPTSLSIIIDQLKYGIKNSQKSTQYRHAKFMLFELNDGRKALITGSNNFNYRGIKYGTMETGLLSYDEKLWQSIHDDFIE